MLEDKRYKADLVEHGVTFPDVEKPTPILYQLPPEMDALYDRTITLLAGPQPDALTYNRYRAIAFLSNLKLREKYERADLVAEQLATIMKTLLVKRLNSSFIAFLKSLGRFRDATQAMVRMFESGKIYIAAERRSGTDVDDGPAAAIEHQWNAVLTADHRSSAVESEHVVPKGYVHIGDGAIELSLRPASVVTQDV